MSKEQYSNPIDQVIYDLFTARWVGDTVTSSLEAMKKQLHKNLTDQINGYASGHTAYNIMVDGGFLVDAKHVNGKPKKLTKFGELFMAEQTAQKESADWLSKQPKEEVEKLNATVQRTEALFGLRDAIQKAEEYGLVRTESDIVITGALDSADGFVLVSE